MKYLSYKEWKQKYSYENCYNTVRYHESLDTDHHLMTPNEAFWTRLPEECKLNMFLDRIKCR
jgi:hypothetical protein